MTIDNRCREQLEAAHQLLTDFQHTRPGSSQQLRSISVLTFLVSMWPEFLRHEVKRLDAAMTLGR